MDDHAFPRGVLAASLALSIGIASAACSDNPQPKDPGAATRTESSPSAASSPAADPRVQEAIDAYEAFLDAASRAEQSPVGVKGPRPPGADFTRYSWDPLRSESAGYIATLADRGIAWRGTPPGSRVTLVSADLDGDTHPVVVLKNCPTLGEDWHAINVETGKRMPAATPSGPQPPYEVTVKVIHYQGRWGAQTSNIDRSRTCTA
jgi:hypothetical protein